MTRVPCRPDSSPLRWTRPPADPSKPLPERWWDDPEFHARLDRLRVEHHAEVLALTPPQQEVFTRLFGQWEGTREECLEATRLLA